eukprot:355192-Chlamydomonas_euryale.AAC.3
MNQGVVNQVCMGLPCEVLAVGKNQSALAAVAAGGFPLEHGTAHSFRNPHAGRSASISGIKRSTAALQRRAKKRILPSRRTPGADCGKITGVECGREGEGHAGRQSDQHFIPFNTPPNLPRPSLYTSTDM